MLPTAPDEQERAHVSITAQICHLGARVAACQRLQGSGCVRRDRVVGACLQQSHELGCPALLHHLRSSHTHTSWHAKAGQGVTGSGHKHS